MTAGLTVAVDAMSGDHGAAVAVPAALDVLASTPDLRLIIVGRGEAVLPLLGAALDGDRCRFVEATEVVAMDERPQDALRRKKNSSMRIAINLVERCSQPRASCSAWCRASTVPRSSPPCPRRGATP
jgi:phosphate acyltransferase